MGLTDKQVDRITPLIIAPPLFFSGQLGYHKRKNRNIKQTKGKFYLQIEKCFEYFLRFLKLLLLNKFLNILLVNLMIRALRGALIRG